MKNEEYQKYFVGVLYTEKLKKNTRDIIEYAESQKIIYPVKETMSDPGVTESPVISWATTTDIASSITYILAASIGSTFI